MELANIQLTDPVDVLMRRDSEEKYRAMLRAGRLTDGVAVHAVNTKNNGQFVEVVTKGEEEFILYCVFVAKIHRENEGLADQTAQAQRAWYHLASAFIDKFGDRSPPDIVEEFNAVKVHLNY